MTVLPIAQLASLVGVYGLSFLLALTSAAAALAIVRARMAGERWAVAVAASSRSLAGRGLRGVGHAGGSRTGALTSVGRRRCASAVVQGNIAQDEKWNPALRDADHRPLSVDDARRRSARGATFILWPESSFAVYFEEDLRGHVVRRLAREAGITLLIGSDQVERGRGPTPRLTRSTTVSTTPRSWSSRTASTAAVYRKMHLVPFGEYVPLQRLLFFVGPIVEAVSNFTPGDATGAAAGRRSHGEHRDLLRGHLRQPDAALRARRQRAADDDHQRRLVRPVVGRVPALGSGGDARHRERPLSRARRQHRHQRLRRSRTAASCRSRSSSSRRSWSATCG